MTVLSDEEINILLEALDDEYKAYATYDQVIEDFSLLAPFSNIRDAEGRHIAALLRLFEKYNLPVPANTWPGQVDRYATLEEACRAGVEAEIANAAMYDRLMGKTQRPDILRVLKNLQAASQQRHLPAFRRCLARGTGLGRTGLGRAGLGHRRRGRRHGACL